MPGFFQCLIILKKKMTPLPLGYLLRVIFHPLFAWLANTFYLLFFTWALFFLVTVSWREHIGTLANQKALFLMRLVGIPIFRFNKPILATFSQYVN